MAPSAEPLAGSSTHEDSGVTRQTGGCSNWESLPAEEQQVKTGGQEHKTNGRTQHAHPDVA